MTIRILHKERKRKIVTQLCLTLVDPTDCNPSGSSVCAVPRARNLEWVATPLSRVSSLPRDRTRVSCIAGRFFSTWATSKAPECFIGVRIWTRYQRKKSIKAVAHSLMKQKHKKSIPWRRKWQPTPVFLPGESHEQRSLAGYSPRGRRVGHDWSDLAHTHTHTQINPSIVRYVLKQRKWREMEPLRGRNHAVTAFKWGGNNGKKVMGCYCCLVTKSSLTLGDPMDCIACQTPLPMGFPRQNNGVGCHFLLQGIFPT